MQTDNVSCTEMQTRLDECHKQQSQHRKMGFYHEHDNCNKAKFNLK